MLHATRQHHRQHHIVTYAISLGLMTAYISLLQPIPSVSAQQLTAPVSQGTSETGTLGRRPENIAPTLLHPTKSLEKKDAQTLINKPHRLIRTPQNAPVASVEPSRSSSSSVSSSPTPTPSLQTDNTISQDNKPSSFTRSVGATVPLATMSATSSLATTTESTAVGTVSTGTIPLAKTGGGHSSTSGNGNTNGRSMTKLAEEMPGLAQLMSPPAAPVVSVNPMIGASPTSLSFTALQGGSNPTAQTLTISNTGGGSLSWSASDSSTWLSLSPASGTGTGTMTVSATTGTLTTGSYSGTVTLSATGASSVTIHVTFTVAAAPVPPAIGASPTALSFTATQGGANPAPQSLSISNTGSGTLTWTASDSATWLTLSPASGTGNGMITLSAVTGTLATGSYSSTVTLSGAAGVTPVTVPVTFTVTAPVVTPTIGLSPTTFSFTATEGAANPAPKTLNIANPGTGTLTWSVTDNASWLTLTPASGTTTTGTSSVTLAVNTAGLLAGPLTAAIMVTATTATNSPQTIPVTLTVSPPTTSSATLTWAANTDSDLAGYKVYRATASGAYGAALATIPPGTLTYQATGLSANTTYFFVLTAYDTAGNESSFSNEVSISIF